jgi:ribosome-associated translation inhibitor RaiA
LSFKIHFHDVPHSVYLAQKCQELSRALSEEFPEALRFDVTQSQLGVDQTTTVHVTGRDLDFASTSKAAHARESVNEAFTKLRRQLRKHHDKAIFNRRRELRAQPN